MYCIKCGVQLSEGQTVCPICNTRVYHPDIKITPNDTYPRGEFKSEEFNRRGLIFVITIMTAILVALPLMLELSWHGEIVWSGYVAGGALLAYFCIVFPFWFKQPNPVIFVPTSFAAAALYLLYICLQTGGSWFLPFAFPLMLTMAAIASAFTTLIRYVKRGRLYIFGGAFIALGMWTMLLEFLIRYAFGVGYAILWSPATLTCFALTGIMLIIIAIVKPLKESLRRIFFIGKL